MRPWAQWTARRWLPRAALVAVGFAATSAGLSGVALAAAGDGNPSGSVSVLGGNQIGLPVSIPATVCGISGALLGVAGAGCSGGATSVTNPETAGPSAASSAASSPSPAGSSSARTSSGGNSASGLQVGSGNQLSVPVSVPADICGNAVAVLGDSSAGCAGGASASTISGGAITGGAVGSAVSGVLTPVKAAVSSALDAVTPQGRTAGALAGLAPVSGLAPGSGAAGNSNGTQGNSSTTSFAQPGAGDPSVPATSQLAGIGALPGLADLPSMAGLTTMPALNGDTGGGVPMPATALSAANAPGMSSNSFAALAVGALLAGASALKIAGRRVRDRRTGLE
jgi:hypothetical protein